ncbi:hypothetical protein [Arthrobacter sp. Marseille-P9274]|uniref:hypothetical protein n=1 Tax=Arthrobacter sp. Marseille-P9274 TaxID=2866572 RepID=UPI0021C5D6BD|nr:hypothetical protein [Arthrobacter sp. Marseille-P9274]
MKDYAAPLLGRGLLGFYAALAKRDSSPVDVLVLGDSISEGYGAGSLTERYAGRLLSNFRTRYGITGGLGYLSSWHASSDIAPLGPTATGNAVKNANGSRGLGLRSYTLGADTGAGLGNLTFTFTGTSFKMLAAQRVAAGTDSVRIVIDGAPYVEWEVVDGTGTSVWDSGPLTAGAHTVSVTARFGLASIEGFMLFDGDEDAGIRLWRARSRVPAHSSSPQLRAALTAGATALPHVDPDLVVIAWMTNDISSRTSEVYRLCGTWSRWCVARSLPRRSCSRPCTNAEPWANYVAAMKKVASEYPWTAFFDIGTHIPNLAGTGGSDP